MRIIDQNIGAGRYLRVVLSCTPLSMVIAILKMLVESTELMYSPLKVAARYPYKCGTLRFQMLVMLRQ
ncbi:hypothetical protein TU76_02310 [Pseudomonas psychrophila]|nr:hypothetical protein TU76_02310 [Pseudomonas psychrophila]